MKLATHALRLLCLVTVAAALYACDTDNRRTAANITGGDPDRGHAAINHYGCGACHTIPGVRGANALVGPPLTQMGARMYVAGMLKNTPENMIKWIQDPPAINPRTAMPNLHVGDGDARDIASYLYTLQ